MKLKALILAILCAVTMTACSDAETAEKEKTVYAMDTVMTLKAYGKNSSAALDAAEKEIFRLDDALRRKNPDSEIYKINKQKSGIVSDETAELINRSLEISASTEGCFDISIAPIMDLWGFYTKEYHVPSAEELVAELTKVNYKNIAVNGNEITLTGDSQLDLGGIAKGYLSSRIAEIFKDNGVKSGIISLGGNVQALGKKPDGSDWNVAIQSPDDENEYIGIISVSDMAVVTSGGYQRFFEQNGVVYHHIINPKTGFPSTSGLKSVTIVSSDGTLADGLSTAIFVMGLEKGEEYRKMHSGFDVIFVTDDDRIYITDGIEDAFKSDNEYSIIKT